MKDYIEPQARANSSSLTMLTQFDLELSIAISLKRIADTLDGIVKGDPLNVYVKE